MEQTMAIRCDVINGNPSIFRELNEVAACAVASLMFEYLRHSDIVFADWGDIEIPNWDGENNCVAIWRRYGHIILRKRYGIVADEILDLVFKNIENMVMIPLDTMTCNRKLHAVMFFDGVSDKDACVKAIFEYRNMLERTIKSYVK